MPPRVMRPKNGGDHRYRVPFRLTPAEHRAIQRLAALSAWMQRLPRPVSVQQALAGAIAKETERLERLRIRAGQPEPERWYSVIDRRMAARYPYYFGSGSPHEPLADTGVPYDPTPWAPLAETRRAEREARRQAEREEIRREILAEIERDRAR